MCEPINVPRCLPSYMSMCPRAFAPTCLYYHMPTCLPEMGRFRKQRFESESELPHFARIRIGIRIHSSFQWIRSLIRILVQRIRIRIRESTVNMHDMHDLKAQYRVPSYVLHIQTLIYLNVLALLIL